MVYGCVGASGVRYVLRTGDANAVEERLPDSIRLPQSV
jgi:hypothetical protein